MKKFVIILLIILPFLLIYFISVTGRILEKYSHIYVESLSVETLEEGVLEDKSTIVIEKGSTQKFKIIVGPELASNQSVKISNFNSEVCSYELFEDELEVTGLKYGVSKIVISSVDQTDINFTLNIKITDDIPTAITVDQNKLSIQTKQYYLSDLVNILFVPTTTKLEYRELMYETTDSNIVKILDSATGLIKGVAEGTCSIIITSKFDTNLKVEVIIDVSNQKSSDVFFDHYTTNAYTVDSLVFDLKTITKFSSNFNELYPNENERFNQFSYKITSGSNYIDALGTDLKNGIIKFTGDGYIKIQIRLNSSPENYVDEITIRCKTK